MFGMVLNTALNSRNGDTCEFISSIYYDKGCRENLQVELVTNQNRLHPLSEQFHRNKIFDFGKKFKNNLRTKSDLLSHRTFLKQ